MDPTGDVSPRQVRVTPELEGAHPPPDPEATERAGAATEDEEPAGPPAVPPLTVDAALIRTVRQGDENALPAAPGSPAIGGAGRIVTKIMRSNLARAAAAASVAAVTGWLLFKGG